MAGLTAAETAHRTRKAERSNPIRGNILTIGDVKLHYLDKGAGPALVLLHGNGSMIEDFETGGILERAAQRYRVLAFDRPGFGHTNRPRGRKWTADEQAKLLLAALKELGIQKPIVLGHSWGAMVALAMAFEDPPSVAGLVLVSGYYFPQARPDALAAGAPAVPVLGAVFRWTVEPYLARFLWGSIKRKLFRPAPVPVRFDEFPEEMAIRPSQLRAAAEEAVLLDSTAEAFAGRYKGLSTPVAIVAGDGDRVVDPQQSIHLHRELPESTLRLIPGAGHMVHHSATSQVAAAIESLAGRTQTDPIVLSRRHIQGS